MDEVSLFILFNFSTAVYGFSALTMSSTPAGTTMGLKDREWGQMGVTMIAGTLGWIMEAPAAAAYAVLPVGVDTITPEGGREDRRGWGGGKGR